MRNSIIFTVLGILYALFVGCSPTQSTSVIYGDNYNKEQDITTITILPYGQVKVSGQWRKTDYNSESRQYFYESMDSVTFAVALNNWNKYEFYRAGMTQEDFIQAFYKWESDYLRDKYNGQIRIVKNNKSNNTIVWNLSNKPEIDSYFLYGLKDQTVYNLYLTTHKWNENTIVEFLEKVYAE